MKRPCIILSLLLRKPAAGQNCTICQGNRTVLDPDQPLNKGGSCGEVDTLVRTLSTEQCDEKEIDIVVSGFRCGCRDDDQFPVCGVRQNPSFCTTGLLEEATETCECYSFCGKDFAGCENYPGDRLTANNCDERAVSGCNYAAAVEGPNPFLLCPGICPDGSTIQNPNRIIPSITLIENFFVPTCQQANEYLKDSDGLDCEFVQSLAGYCGCEGVEKRKSCSFCPENQESQNLDFKTSSFFTCLDLVDYVEFLSPLDCNRTLELSETKNLQELQEICACTPVPTTAPTAPPSENENANANDAPTSSPIQEDITTTSSASAYFFPVLPLLSLLIFLNR